MSSGNADVLNIKNQNRGISSTRRALYSSSSEVNCFVSAIGNYDREITGLPSPQGIDKISPAPASLRSENYISKGELKGKNLSRRTRKEYRRQICNKSSLMRVANVSERIHMYKVPQGLVTDLCSLKCSEYLRANFKQVLVYYNMYSFVYMPGTLVQLKWISTETWKHDSRSRLRLNLIKATWINRIDNNIQNWACTGCLCTCILQTVRCLVRYFLYYTFDMDIVHGSWYWWNCKHNLILCWISIKSCSLLFLDTSSSIINEYIFSLYFKYNDQASSYTVTMLLPNRWTQ